jgi:Undecaprenyl-phosphate glucose phosphotransferase
VFDSTYRLAAGSGVRSPRFALTHAGLMATAFALEFVSILLTAIVTGVTYHWIAYGYSGSLPTFAAVGSLAALGYCLTFLIRNEYGFESLFDGHRPPGHIFLAWNLVFVGFAVIGFLTKGTQIYSRGWLVLFYAVGAGTVLLMNSAIVHGLGMLISCGLVRARKLMIVATDADLPKLEQEITACAAGFAIVARVGLERTATDSDGIDRVLDAAVASARAMGIEDVFISDTFSGHEFLDRAVQAFSALPVAIHLSAGGLVARFKHARVLRFGKVAALSLTRAPLGPFEAATKRWFDILVSAIALLLLSPLFALIAVLIKCDSRGPVFFRQRRRGYNTAEFRIWKFRTMTTMEDGDIVTQATKGDARITFIGSFLRRFSLDELPQLINVLKGEMSLVGPRPHAVAHDRFFERRITGYPRRLNVKPGITGWAQVNGFRGATDTDEAMQRRVEHDIFYIDNCSIGFDLYILLLTLISPKASRNAR